MAILYRYECKPNYPGISKAFVIFAVSNSKEDSALLIGRELAEWAGCSNVEEDEALTKLADIGWVYETKALVNGCTILHYENGEY